jgi:hypothetical protein
MKGGPTGVQSRSTKATATFEAALEPELFEALTVTKYVYSGTALTVKLVVVVVIVVITGGAGHCPTPTQENVSGSEMVTT